MNTKQDEPWDFSRHSPMPRPKDDDGDIDRLLKNDGMIRSAKKIAAVVANAQTMQKVEQEFGSFANYLQAVKAKDEDALLKDLHKRFAFLGESTSVIFLFSVGEDMPETVNKIQAAHGKR